VQLDLGHWSSTSTSIQTHPDCEGGCMVETTHHTRVQDLYVKSSERERREHHHRSCHKQEEKGNQKLARNGCETMEQGDDDVRRTWNHFTVLTPLVRRVRAPLSLLLEHSSAVGNTPSVHALPHCRLGQEHTHAYTGAISLGPRTGLTVYQASRDH
jgi:hypothetical protein